MTATEAPPAPTRAPESAGPDASTTLVPPPTPRSGRLLLLGATFVCAASGLVYELALVALGTYLFGASIYQTSIVISVFVFSMGVGSLVSKRLHARPVTTFAAVELALAGLGGLSVVALYASFAWLDLYEPVLVVLTIAIGSLIGVELPLLMTLIQRLRRQDAGTAVGDLFAADYIGALLGGLAFPFVLLPWLGLIRGTILAGAVNAVAAAVVVGWLFRRDLSAGARASVAAAFICLAGLLGAFFVAADGIEVTARQRLYRDPIVHSERSRYQEIVLTETRSLDGDDDLRLYLDGDLQFSSVDEYRYHESLVHPAITPTTHSVLILGGGDGLAAREVLRHPDVRHVVEVELDPAVIALARTDPRLSALNGGSLDDPRVTVVGHDALGWLRSGPELFDTVIVDMPDPDDAATAKLYSVEFYGLVRNALAPGGRVVVQAGSPFFSQEAYWCVVSTLEAAGFGVTPYQIDVPSFGNWGFALAARGAAPPLVLEGIETASLRFLDEATLGTAAVFPTDRRRIPVDVSTLLRPVILDYAARGWRHY